MRDCRDHIPPSPDAMSSGRSVNRGPPHALQADITGPGLRNPERQALPWEEAPMVLT